MKVVLRKGRAEEKESCRRPCAATVRSVHELPLEPREEEASPSYGARVVAIQPTAGAETREGGRRREERRAAVAVRAVFVVADPLRRRHR
ncbi:hypothetical protein Ahy_A04g020700 isoform C [Arachis hypogaea]|uniref:Uncharacterized protein n=1 Tax=Arachis hypogaea TaxID=3818 RepID=A0A445DIF4_ARAHY|nr:hypothetical protein Ahy_A04g020700 isoform C [Arachis hypogaea]